MTKIAFWLSFLLLSSCSFHLRGVAQLSQELSPIAIVCTEVTHEWNGILRQKLQTANLNVVDTPADARYWILLQNEDIQRNIMSISSGSSSRQYQLIYRVVFSLKKTKAQEIIPNTPILATRILTINNDRILGSHDEEEKIINDMRRDIAIQIVYRLAAVSRTLPIKKQQKTGL